MSYYWPIQIASPEEFYRSHNSTYNATGAFGGGWVPGGTSPSLVTGGSPGEVSLTASGIPVNTPNLDEWWNAGTTATGGAGTISVPQTTVQPPSTTIPASTIPVPEQLTPDKLTNASKYNMENIDDILKLSEMINAYNIEAQKRANAARVPGSEAADALELRNIMDAQNFVVPEALRAATANEMAWKIGATGSPWGDNSGAGYGTAIMRKMIERADTAGERLARLKASNPAATVFDISTMLMTPAQAAEIDIKLQALANELYGTRLNDETKRYLTKIGIDTDLYKAQLDDESKKWLLLQQLDQQMKLGTMDDNTKRWIAQLDADTRLQISRLASMSGSHASGGSPTYSGGGGSAKDIVDALFGGGGHEEPTTTPSDSWAEDWWADFDANQESGGGNPYVGDVNIPDWTNWLG